MRQLAQRMFFDPADDWTMRREPHALDPNHPLLLAIERALAPPIVHMRSTFQPMRIVIVKSDLIAHGAGEGDLDIPLSLPHALPQAASMSAHAQSQFHQRSIQGEILVGEGGKLYEKLGHRIRPVHQLASGPFGELIELVPFAQPNLRLIGPSALPKVVENQETSTSFSACESKPEDRRSSKSPFLPLRQTAETANGNGYRKLFADPGQWRVVWWAEFKEVLAHQMAHPERLSDTYRLPCYVQVIEIERPMTRAELAASIASKNERPKPLYFLTPDIAAKLDLISLLPPIAVPASNAQRAPDTLLPHDRLFRLVVANDPTVDVATLQSKLHSSSDQATSVLNEQSKAGTERVKLRKEIPARFLKDWEFTITREEALYDISSKQTFGAKVRQWIRNFRIFKPRAELQKWQHMLIGKTADEQLWMVRLPKGGLANADVCEWARQTLALAGYDAETMLKEWEIFWRRKGLT